MFVLNRYRATWAIPTIRWLAAARFFAAVTFFSSVIVPFLQSRGLSFTQMFLLESVLSLALLVSNIPTGLLADLWGYRTLLIIGQSISLLGLVFFVVAHAYWVFLISEFLGGIGLACLDGCEQALAYQSVTDQADAAPAFALLAFATQAGFLSGLVVGSFLGAISLTLPVALNFIPQAFALVAFWRLPSQPRPAPHEQPPALAQLRALAQGTIQIIRRYPALIGISLVQQGAFAITNAIFWYNQPYFRQAGIALIWFGPLTAIAVTGAMAAVLSMPAIRTRLGFAASLGLACLAPGIAYLVLALRGGPWLAVIGVTVIAASQSWRQPLVNDALNQPLADTGRATALSALSFLGSLVAIALNPLVGAVGDHGLVVTGLSLGAVLLALALIGYVIGRSAIFRPPYPPNIP